MEHREIKFRAWNTKYNEMIYLSNSGLQYFDFEGAYSLGFTVDGYKGFWAHEQYESPTKEASKFPLMQYTGLKDKNGVEIYEGDIVHSYYEIQGTHNGKDYFGTDKFKHENFKVVEFKDGAFWSGSLMKGKIHEVIGNIYQSPELLESNN